MATNGIDSDRGTARGPRWVRLVSLSVLPLGTLVVGLLSGRGVLPVDGALEIGAATCLGLLGAAFPIAWTRSRRDGAHDLTGQLEVQLAGLGGLGFIATRLASELVAQPTGRSVGILLCLSTLLAEVGLLGAVLNTGGVLQRFRGVLVRLAYSASLLTLALAPVEAWLASTPERNWYAIAPIDGSDTRLLVEDQELRWRLRPGFRGRHIHPEFGGVLVETNSIGLRDRELEADAPDPAVVLGDSFAFAIGVPAEQTLARRLEAGGAGGRVWNTGVMGYSTLDELIVLDRLAERLRPRLVVLLVYLGNDLEENIRSLERHLEIDDGAMLAGLMPTAGGFEQRLAALGNHWTVDLRDLDERSWLRIRLERRSSIVRRAAEALDQTRTEGGGASGRPPLNDLLLRSCAKRPDPDVELALDVTVDAVRAVAERAGRLDARTIVCLAPARFQVDEALYYRSLERLGLDPDRYSPDRLQSVLRARCDAHGIELVDPTIELRRRTEAGEQVYFREGHWSPAGNAVAAEAVLDWLAAHPAPTAPKTRPADNPPR